MDFTNGDTERQFPTNTEPAEGESQYQDMIDFITIGSENGKQYGLHGQGSGRMPGFGVSPNAVEDVQRLRADLAGMSEDNGMFTPEQIEAIVIYEREVIGQEGQTARSSD